MIVKWLILFALMIVGYMVITGQLAASVALYYVLAGAVVISIIGLAILLIALAILFIGDRRKWW